MNTRRAMRLDAHQQADGFTLVEMAVVLAIVGLLVGGMMMALSAQTEQRSRDGTLRRLEEAKELLIAFAIVNGRLPCPARCSNYPDCNAVGDGGDEAVAGGVCTDPYAGYLPGRTIGFLPVDSSGYALDSWGNRIRYAVANTISSGTSPHFTNVTNLKTNGITTTPTDLMVCASTTAAGYTTSPPSSSKCGNPGTGTAVTNNGVVASVIWSHGKNYTTVVAGGTDETENNKHRLPATQNNHPVFIWHEPRPSGAAGGEFDDLLVWIPAGMLYGKLIAAGQLP
jgi:prepilin-type N-terminal cleavage/methylation domain-containing protein